jgi:hypothetical protein
MQAAATTTKHSNDDKVCAPLKCKNLNVEHCAAMLAHLSLLFSIYSSAGGDAIAAFARTPNRTLPLQTRVLTGSPGEAFFQRNMSAHGCLTFEGRRLCLPQVFVLGAHKSGTTDLFHRITAHPEIRRPRAKENNFWCRVAPAAFAANSSRALLAYASGVSRELGNPSPALRVVAADGTPANFMCNKGLPDLLRRIFRSQLRVVVLTRDPVARAWSEFRYFARIQRKWNKACYYGAYGQHLEKKAGEMNDGERAKGLNKWRSDYSVREAYDRSVRQQARSIDKCYSRGWNSAGCHWLCKSQLQLDPWRQCPLPRLLPGLTTPLVNMWREALPRHTIHVADSTDYLRQPAAFLGEVFAFLGVRTLNPEEMRAIVALPTELVTSALDEQDDPPWQATLPFTNTSTFLTAWYQNHANSSACWE